MPGSISCFQCPDASVRRSVIILLCLFWSLTGFAQQNDAGAAAGIHEIWAESRLAGQPTGYYHEKTEPATDHQVVTSIDNDFVMNREGSKVEMKSTSRFEEAVDGRLLRVQADISSSKQVTHLDIAAVGDALRIQTTTGGKTYERSVPLTGTLVGPDAARRLTISRLKSAGDTVAYQTYSPELGSAAILTATLAGREKITIAGDDWSSLKVEQSLSGMPGKVTVWMDGAGYLLRQVLPTPFGDLETVRTSQDKIQLAAEGASLPAETFSRTVVPANIRLPEERLIEEIKIRITHRKPELGWPDFEAENQEVLEKTAKYVVLRIRRTVDPKEAHRPVGSTAQLAPYLAANALLQSDDANIQSIARQVVGTDANLLRSARALQRWTNDNMRFDMGIALAPASEVVRDRRGTCIAYSMLLGSLARAAGIPSRIRMGFVYVNGAWGGHAWVDVLAGNEWVSLDGALNTPGPVDAARFSAFTGSFEDGGSASMEALAQLAGNIDIQTLEYTVNGRTVVVPEDAPAFMVDGDTYRNPWMGLTVTKPKAFHFTRLKEIWPEDTVVAMEGSQHQLVEIESQSGSLPTSNTPDYAKYLHDAGIIGQRREVHFDGRRGVLVTSAEKAGLVLAQEGQIWVVKASGPSAARLLLQVAETIRLSDTTTLSAGGR